MIKNRFLTIGWFNDRGFGLNLAKMGYNEYRPHQSFDNKTPMQVRIEATKHKQEDLHLKKLENWNAFYWTIPGRTNTAVC